MTRCSDGFAPQYTHLFGARYYAPTLGRFLTPDWSATPEPIPYANLQNPQSLNLYSYALNNPATATDPDGHWCILGWGSTCSKGTKLQPKEGGAAAAAGTDALTGGLDTTAILDGLKALGDAAVVGASEFTVVFATINSPGDADPELLAREKGASGSKPSAPPPKDPSQPPGPGWEWRGRGAQGSSAGSWFNPSTDESLHPDLQHGDPVGPHWDYTNSLGEQFRIMPDGTSVPK